MIKAFSSEAKAFAAGGDKVAALCLEGKPNCGFRVLRQGDQYRVLMVPERTRFWDDGTPYYLCVEVMPH